MPYGPLVQITNGWPSFSNPGRLRHEITIQQLAASSPITYDDAGPVLSWQTFTTATAAIEAMRGFDVIRGGQTTAQEFLTVGFWWQAGVLPNMRVVVENGATYIIQSIENVLEMNAILLLNCVALNVNEI